MGQASILEQCWKQNRISLYSTDYISLTCQILIMNYVCNALSMKIKDIDILL